MWIYKWQQLLLLNSSCKWTNSVGSGRPWSWEVSCSLWLSSRLVEEKPLCFTAVLYSFFEKVISEVTERIPAILSHNIWSRCNLIMHPQKLVDLYPQQKNHPKTPKMGISETEFDIRWRITLQQNFTSTIAAITHWGTLLCQCRKRRELWPQNEGLECKISTHISESIRASGDWGHSAPSVNLGPPDIPETSWKFTHT